MLPEELQILRLRAVKGDKDALTKLVGLLVGDIHRLVARMIWDVSDAEDATQEVLIKVVTKLDSFDGNSSLKTWVYRITVNHLLDRRRAAAESLSFDVLAADLRDGLADPKAEFQPELEALAEEVKVTCTGAMLSCLDRPHRIAYVLGDILEIPGPTAADILGVSAATFRKRLSRARSDIRTFMANNCGLVAEEAPCRCTRRVNRAVELGRIGHRPPADQSSVVQHATVLQAIAEIQQLQGVQAVMRSTLVEDVPHRVLDAWRSVLDTSTALIENP